MPAHPIPMPNRPDCDPERSMSTLLLIVLVLVVAAVGGSLGTLLEVAGWFLLVLILLGALVGFARWRVIDSVRSRV
jgi:hypothetical protein